MSAHRARPVLRAQPEEGVILPCWTQNSRPVAYGLA